jgi:hypothetical protein
VTRARPPLVHAARLGAAAALVVAACWLAACADEPPTESRLLVLDGIEFRLAEVEPYVKFLDVGLPEGGRKTKILRVLEDYLIPLRIAQRTFAAERAAKRKEAEAMASVATNVHELDARSKLLTDRFRRDVPRNKAPLPVAMHLFDPALTGSVSPPIELPHGWILVAAFDFKQSPLALDDYVDSLQVGFLTHTAGAWQEWFAAQKPSLADKATFVHPDYETAIPQWIQPPKRP